MKNRNFIFNYRWIFFVIPVLTLISFIYINPILTTIIYSLRNWDYLHMGNFNRFANYISILSSKHFFESLLNNLIIIIIVIPVVIIGGLFFAQFIYLKIPGYKYYNFIFFIPVVLPDIIVAKVFTTLLNKTGPINTILTKIGLGFFAIDWFGNPRFSLYSIIITIIWKSVGFAMILFLARLTTIDYSIYESAKIDGASDMQLFRYISIPMLKNIIQITIVLQLISLTSFLFNYIYVMTQGGPGFSSTVLEYFIYIYAFKYQNIGISSASGLFLIFATGFLVYFYLFINKRQER